MVCPVLLHRRGVSRSSRTLAAGCDGRFGFTAPTARTNGAEAYGQGAWSRPPDAGVKSDGDHPAGDGGYQARYSGESALYALTPLRREGRTVSATCGDDSCAFYLCTRGCGCAKHPAFPAPSVLRGACKTDNSGKSCRENVDARHCERKRFDTRHGRARPGHPRLTALASQTGRPNSNCRQQSIESSRREANA